MYAAAGKLDDKPTRTGGGFPIRRGRLKLAIANSSGLAYRAASSPAVAAATSACARTWPRPASPAGCWRQSWAGSSDGGPQCPPCWEPPHKRTNHGAKPESAERFGRGFVRRRLLANRACLEHAAGQRRGTANRVRQGPDAYCQEESALAHQKEFGCGDYRGTHQAHGRSG